MKYDVNNTTGKGKAFKVYGGLEVVAPNTKAIVDCESKLTDKQIAAHEAAGVFIKPAKAKAAEDEKSPEREALEKEAEELDVKFAPNLGDEKLQERIDEAKAKDKAPEE